MKTLAVRKRGRVATSTGLFAEVKALAEIKNGTRTITSSPLSALVVIIAVMLAGGSCFAFVNSYAKQVYQRQGSSISLSAVPLGDEVSADDYASYDLAFRPTVIVLHNQSDAQSCVLLRYGSSSVTALYDVSNNDETWVVTRKPERVGFSELWSHLDGRVYRVYKFDENLNVAEERVFDEAGVLETVYLYEYADDGTRLRTSLSPEEYYLKRGKDADGKAK